MRATFKRQRPFVRANPGGVSKLLHAQIKRLIRGAIKAFIDAAIELVRMDTGMARSSLLPLAAEVRYRSEIQGKTTGNRPPRRGWTDINGQWNSTGFTSRARGERIGREMYTIRFGTPRRPVVVFTFDVRIFQWAFWDSQWGALDAAWAAFQDYIENDPDDILNARQILDYIQTGRSPFITEFA